jgi:ubiquinone/menaquinone biosynthesis C-methylase UbiE
MHVMNDAERASAGYYFDPEEAAAYDYEPWQMRDDIPFYVRQAEFANAAGQPVLELACGTGRVTIPIARAGCDVTGLDNSPAMLDIARRKAAAESVEIAWFQGDMRTFKLDRQFGLIIIPYRSFLALLTVEDEKACLRCVHDHLLPGGRLALNFFNPSIVMMADWQTQRSGALQRFASLDDDKTGKRREYWQSNTYRTGEQLLEHLRVIEELAPDGTVVSRRYRTLILRYLFRYEMEHLLSLTGFEVEHLYGWFDERAFSDDSGEMIWVARRP